MPALDQGRGGFKADAGKRRLDPNIEDEALARALGDIPLTADSGSIGNGQPLREA